MHALPLSKHAKSISQHAIYVIIEYSLSFRWSEAIEESMHCKSIAANIKQRSLGKLEMTMPKMLAKNQKTQRVCIQKNVG